jgi:Cof subfamily protein (haloacid dehalogenase superfamily)
MKTHVSRRLLIDQDPDLAALESRASSLTFPERSKALHMRDFAVCEPPTEPNRDTTKLNRTQLIENKRRRSPQIATKIHFSAMRYLHSGMPEVWTRNRSSTGIPIRDPQARYNSQMPVKLIAMDIDGTLLDGNSQVPGENREAITEAVARGIEVVLVTGRRFDFARPIAEQLPCELHLIVNNGALIKSKCGETHLRRLLPSSTARGVLEQTAEFRSCAAVVFDRPRENQVIMERVDWDDPVRGGYFRRNREYIAELAPLTGCLDGTDPIQVMFVGGCRRMREAMQRLERLPFANEFTLALTEYESRDLSILDVLRRGVSKGAALSEWARRRGIAREAVMAIGDNWNDREMLEFAGLPIVMGNSVPELKSLGWAVTLSNDQAGVAEAIRTYALKET